jgi:hypothetical protein
MSDIPLRLGPELFAPVVGSEFQLRAPDGRTLPVVLTKLTEANRDLNTTQFSLLFRVPAGGPTQQAVYTLEQERVGSVQLLLVPVAQLDDGLLFEAAIALLGRQETERSERQ